MNNGNYNMAALNTCAIWELNSLVNYHYFYLSKGNQIESSHYGRQASRTEGRIQGEERAGLIDSS